MAQIILITALYNFLLNNVFNPWSVIMTLSF